MESTLHITNGDCAGDGLKRSGISGEILIWQDVLYDGTRNPGWPTQETLIHRAQFLEEVTGGGVLRENVLKILKAQYLKLAEAEEYERIVLWFDACLLDQSMLAHLLNCIRSLRITNVDLLCIHEYPGVNPFNGLGQLAPGHLATLYDSKVAVNDAQYEFAEEVDSAFAKQDLQSLEDISSLQNAPLPWIPAAAARWLEEQPDPDSGLGKLEDLALQAVRNGLERPMDIFFEVASADDPPIYWGDTTLWAKINGLADRNPPFVHIIGPEKRLPQWYETEELNKFRICPL